MTSRLTLIVNPQASNVDEGRIERVVDRLDRNARVDVVRTSGRAHAVDLAREAADDADAIVVYSGDGGFNEALNGLPRDVPIGFLPGGRTNVLSRALGLPRDVVAAAERVGAALADGRRRRISVGRVNGRRFGFSAGIGFDAELVRRVDEHGRSDEGRRPGDLAFARAALQTVGRRRSSESPGLEIANVGRAVSVLVANCDPYTYFGPLALHLAPSARFELGLDVVAPASANARAFARVVAYALVGRAPARSADVLYRHDLDRIEIRCDGPLPLQVDGEDLGDVTEAVVECERLAVSVLV
jgi:diacylglycerol kinase family enzyme